ncbi:MAG: LemA family protein, partial [Chloroflexota bacterium]|nr:LemA family protein [Chloroflexota bacterium]
MELIIIVVILVVLALFLILGYNRLVTLRQRVREAWADIDVQLKRRHDLIPNLVETVKGYAAHERGVFEEVTRARAAAVSAGAQASLEQRAQ